MNDNTNIAALRILLVEANPTDALLLEATLAQAQGVKITLTAVERLDEALLRLQTDYFDAVLLDLDLPDSSGLDTFTRMQNHFPSVPILVLSGLDDETLALAVVRDGAQDYLVKGTLESITLGRTIRYAIERKRAAEKLAALELGYRRLFETAQDGILILDAETGRIAAANPFLENLLGYSTAEFIGKRLWEISPFRTREANQIAFHTLQEKGFIQYDDLPLATKDGRLIEVEFMSNVYSIGDKQLIQCNIRDIRERKQSELAEHEAQRFLQSTLDALSSHIAVLDESGKIIAVNKVWSQFAEANGGAAVACGVGANYVDVCDTARDEWAAEGPRVAQGIREVMAGQRPIFSLEYFCPSPAEARWFEVRVTRFDGDGPVHVAIAHENITARKLAEAELRASDEKFRQLVDNISDVFWIRSADMSTVHYISPAFEHIWGCPVETLYANPQQWTDFILPEDRERVQEAFTVGTRDASGVDVEYRIVRPDAEIRWIRGRGFPVRDADGRVIRHTGIVTDITKRKQVEQALQNSEQRFSHAFEYSAIGMALVDLNGRWLQVNRSLCDLLGHSAEELGSLTFQDITHPDDLDKSLENLHAMLDGKTRFCSMEKRYFHKQGQLLWILVGVSLVRDGKGQPLYFVTQIQDITERKRAAEASALLAAIVESSEDAIISKTLDGIITSWNVGAQNLYGYTAEEAIGRPVSFLAPPELLNERPTLLAKIRRGEPVKHYETVRVRKDGSRLEISLSLSPIKDAQGNIIGVSSIKRDITQAKRIAQELQESKARFESIVTNVPGMVYQFVIQPDGSANWPFVGKGFQELFEAEPEILKSNPCWHMDQVHPDDRSEFDRSVATSEEKLLPRSWEGRLRLASGTIKWIQINSRPQRLPAGGTLWNGLILDITARKAAEAERDRFFTISLDLLCIADHNGYFKRLNPAFEATLGFSHAELVSKPFLEWVHPDDRAATLSVMQDLDAGLPTFEFVNRYLCRDGSYRWLSWVSAPYEGTIYAAAHDVTSLKNAEAALHKANDELELNVIERTAELSRANEHLRLEMIERQAAEASLYKNHEFLQAVLENTAEGIMACDAEGQLTFFNRATREFHGLPPEALPSDHWGEYYSLYLPDGSTPLQQTEVPLFQALGGNHVRDMEIVIAPHEGSPHLLVTNGEPLFGAAGEKLGAVVVMHDITQRKQAEVELQRAKQEADAANLAKSEFLSRMSHELRTPLNAVLGFGQILEMSRRLNDQDIEAVDHILKGGRHLLGLINEVLDIASIEAGRISISPEPIRFSQTVREVLDMVRPLATTRRIQIVNELAEHDDRHVRADQQRFRQVLLNLLANAIKYNCDGGRVAISCATSGKFLRFNVSDTGSGLTPEQVGKLFVPFERLGAATSQVEGTGLGLVLCKKLVEAMEGRIGVDSVPGQGSTFWVEFPLAASQSAQLDTQLARSGDQFASPTGPDPSLPQEEQRTVLYIEDNLANFKMIERILAERPQLKLLPAMQGSIGLDLACQHRPDLILLDLHLPDIPGDVVLHRLRAASSTREIPVVVLSADATAAQIHKLCTAGIEHYLTKPIDVRQFLLVLDEIFSKKDI